MAENKLKIADLGDFAKDFNKILKKYKIEKKGEQVLQVLDEAILGKVSEVDLVDLFIDQLKLDFDQATDLAYDFKIAILDKKDKLETVKHDLQKKVQGKFSPVAMADEFLAKLPEFKVENENVKKRFIEALVSWLKDIRDLAELKEVLTRSGKIGGIGMSEATFDKLYDLLVVKKEEISKAGVNLAEIIADYEASLPKEEAMPTTTEIEEVDIDVAAKPVKSIKEKETLTGEEITIDQLLKNQGVEFEELAKKEAIKKELQAKEEAKQKMTEKELAKPDLFKEIKEEEEFLESKAELAPPPPVPVVPEIEVKPDIKAESKQKEEKSPFEDFDFPEPVVAPEKKTEVTAKAVAEKSPFEDFDFPEPVVTPKTEIKEKPVLAPSKPLTASQPVVSPPEVKQPIFKKEAAQPGGRPRVEDVKFTPKLYGPVEELASLKIADLRRLSKEPQEAVNKIIAKLDLLEDESLVKRVEGIKALKKSPLYKVYADIMNKAINQGKSFEQVIEETDDLTLAEFKAIMELNKNLKY